MDPEVTPKSKTIGSPLAQLLTPLTGVVTVLKNLLTPLEKLPIPKKLVIPVIAGAVLLITGGAAFGLLHARPKSAAIATVKALASAPVTSTTASSKAAPSTTAPSEAVPPTAGSAKAVPSAACGGVVRDIYRQTTQEDPTVTLAEVRSEVASSGVNCVPVPAIAAELKDLSPACRDMVQYTFLGVRDANSDITVNDVRAKVVEKSVACEHDRRSPAKS